MPTLTSIIESNCPGMTKILLEEKLLRLEEIEECTPLYSHRFHYVKGLCILKKARFLDHPYQALFLEKLQAHPHPYSFAIALATLHNTPLLREPSTLPVYLEKIFNHATPRGYAIILRSLFELNFLSNHPGESMESFLEKVPDLSQLGNIIHSLRSHGLMQGTQGQENFLKSIELAYMHPTSANIAIELLGQFGLLSGEMGQANFETLIEISSILIKPDESKRILEVLRETEITLDLFNQITTICRQNKLNPNHAIELCLTLIAPLRRPSSSSL